MRRNSLVMGPIATPLPRRAPTRGATSVRMKPIYVRHRGPVALAVIATLVSGYFFISRTTAEPRTIHLESTPIAAIAKAPAEPATQVAPAIAAATQVAPATPPTPAPDPAAAAPIAAVAPREEKRVAAKREAS